MKKQRINLFKPLLFMIVLFQIGFAGSMSRSLINRTVSFGIQNNRAEFSDLSGLVTEVGMPELPLEKIAVALPLGVDPKTVTVELVGIAEDLCGKNITVDPAKPLYAEGKPFIPHPHLMNGGFRKDIYESDNVFPRDIIYSTSIGMFHEVTIVEVYFSPFRYKSISGEITKITEGMIKINWVEPQRTSDKSISPTLLESLKAIVDNASDFEPFVVRNDRIETYAILTEASLQNQLSSLEKFMGSKQGQGFAVKVFTESTWGGGTGAEAAKNIRKWLQNNYKTLNITHVLFIGNPSTGGVPMMNIHVSLTQSKYVTYGDMYHAELSGDWDLNKDGKFGTFSGDVGAGGADRFCELNVARIPYYGNIQEVNAVLDNTIAYAAEKSANAAWRKNVFIPMSDFDAGAWDGMKYGAIVTDYALSKAQGIKSKSLYSPNTSMSAVLKTWNEEPLGFVIWQAHGLTDYAENVMNSSNANQLTNSTKRCFTYQTSCHTGKPESANNLAWAVLKKTGIATVGAGTVCMYAYNKTIWFKKAEARDMGAAYALHLVGNQKSAAVSLNTARSTLTADSETDWINVVELNIYGCPAVGLYTTDIISTPIALSTKSGIVEQDIQIKSVGKAMNVQFANPSESFGKISMYTLSGRKISEKPFLSGTKNVVLDVASSGVYISEITIGSKRIIKQTIIQ